MALEEKNEAYAFSDIDDPAIPDSFICPITQKIMEDPVFTDDGHTYERTAITKWFEIKLSSPKTGLDLSSAQLRPNHALRNAIEDFVKISKKEQAEASQALLAAAKTNQLALVEYIIQQKKANPNITDEEGCTPLMYASLLGNVEMVKLLTTQGKADFHKETILKDTALKMALIRGHFEIVRWFSSKYNFDVNQEFSMSVYSNNKGAPVLSAAASGNLDLLRWLIKEKKADVSARTGAGETMLMLAARCGHLNIAEYLISEKIGDIGATDRYGNTALMIAEKWGKTEVSKYLHSVKLEAKEGPQHSAESTPALLLAGMGGFPPPPQSLPLPPGADSSVADKGPLESSNHSCK